MVIVHEWTDPALVAELGRIRLKAAASRSLSHDTHHRAVSAERDIARLDLSGYDFVLAFGEALRERYLQAGWGRHVHTWHEAADTSLFHPMPDVEKRGELIWIGNWGDDERSSEIMSFLVEPAKKLKLRTTVRGVRYPETALRALRSAKIDLWRLARQCRCSAGFRPSIGSPCTFRAGLMSRPCRAYRRSASSRRLPAAFR